MLNVYPDSIGGNLKGTVAFLQNTAVEGAFHNLYILPSIYNSDLDRGFSVISYDLNENLATKEDLQNLHVGLKLDFVLNHASVQSPQFQDILAHGNHSHYKDFFINWNTFWADYGHMTDKGYIQPDPQYLEGMYLRKEGLPILMVEMPDGTEVPYWNTFYQQKISRRKYLGQMDLNIHSPLVWDFYENTLEKLASYGGSIIRLDAFAYAAKQPGARNFLNEPETWNILKRIRLMADKYNLQLLPEIHAEYREKVHEKICKEGYTTYDFFLPGLLIHAIEKRNGEYLIKWIHDIQQKELKTVNMLGCHDGIPLLDLRGLLPDDEIDETIAIIVSRGGYVKNVQSKKKMYYQVNATYFSALGENENKMLLARALQLFMPGKPQVWYLDLFGGKNDMEAVRLAGEGGHKEINRTNLSNEQVNRALKTNLTLKQLELLRFRNTHPAFEEGAVLTVTGEGSQISLVWNHGKHMARLDADLYTHIYTITKTS